ncbi:MAG: adenosylcobinamide-GDP ribazoletransferase [Nitrospinota bacterium]|nr:adenosylcobinamide-GDP ribazoletransferase [Nitrospinota bacterium]
MRRLLAAVGFLTIIPLPRKIKITAEDHGGSAIFYPLVGLGIGMALAFMFRQMTDLAPPLPIFAILVVAMSMISGGLHMDGLADSFDGFMSARPREQALEIMRDSRMGAMGGLAMMSVLLIKFSSLAVMDGNVPALALVMAAVAGRGAMSLAIVIFPYVRAEGLGAPLSGRAGWGTVVMALLITGLAGVYTGFSGLTGAGYYMWAIMLVWTVVFGLYCRRRIGGMTGDTYGALCETTEALALFIVAGHVYGG